jgi:lipid A 3-O-deacylase
VALWNREGLGCPLYAWHGKRLDMIWRKALFLNLTVAFILLSGLDPAAGADKPGHGQTTTLVDLILKDRFSMQLISGVLYSPIIENGSRPDFNYWQSNLRFIWVLDPEKTARKIGLKGNFDFIFELTSSFIFDGPGNVITGVTGILRYDFFRSYERFRFYAQGGVGIVYTDAHEDLSQALIGNPIEFTPQFSVGSRYLLSKHWSLDIEAMFHHISNAGINDRNKGVNALGGFFGVTYYFSP